MNSPNPSTQCADLGQIHLKNLLPVYLLKLALTNVNTKINKYINFWHSLGKSVNQLKINHCFKTVFKIRKLAVDEKAHKDFEGGSTIRAAPRVDLHRGSFENVGVSIIIKLRCQV